MIATVVLTVVVVAATAFLARFLTRFATAGEEMMYGTTDPVEVERIRAATRTRTPRTRTTAAKTLTPQTRVERAVWAAWNELPDDHPAPVKDIVEDIAQRLGMDPADVAFIVYPVETFGRWDDNQEPDP